MVKFSIYLNRRVFVMGFHMKKNCILGYPKQMRPDKILIRLHEHAAWSENSLVTHVRRCVFGRYGSLRMLCHRCYKSIAKRKTSLVMYRFRSSCACAKYHQGLCYSFSHFVVFNDFVSGRWRPWIDWPDAQADLSILCPLIPNIFAWRDPPITSLLVHRCGLGAFLLILSRRRIYVQ